MDPENLPRRRMLKTLFGSLAAVTTVASTGMTIKSYLDDVKLDEKKRDERVDFIDMATSTLKDYLEIVSEVRAETGGQGKIYSSDSPDEENLFIYTRKNNGILIKALNESLTLNAIKDDSENYRHVYAAYWKGGTMDQIRVQQFCSVFKDLVNTQERKDFFKKVIAHQIFFDIYFKENPVISDPDDNLDEDGKPYTKEG